MASQGKCEACGVLTKIEGHHVFPISYGGKMSGMLAYICPNCHTQTHMFIEDETLTPPPYLYKMVLMGRRAKAKFHAGELVALDRRPTLNIPLTKEDAALLKELRVLLRQKSNHATVLEALRFCYAHVRRVQQ